MATELLERDELLAVMTAAKRLKATPPPERARALGQRLFELVEDPEWKVREEVAWALVHYPGEEASTQLQILASDSVSQVARTAKQALKDRRWLLPRRAESQARNPSLPWRAEGRARAAQGCQERLRRDPGTR